jgi:cytochrome c biogenesis protein CcdA
LDPTVLLLTALVLGALHSVEPDHLAAVSAFVLRRPGRRAAIGYGLRWGLGHAGIILVLGTAIVLLRIQVGDAAGAWLERAVGVSLVLLGGWVLATARTLHAHVHVHQGGPEHVHLHAHPTALDHDAPAAHEHRHAATAMGMLHGLAGTAPAVALVPLARMDSPLLAAGYLAVFGLGTAAAMALYAMFAGALAARAAERSAVIGRVLARCAGAGSVVVGIWWLLRA